MSRKTEQRDAIRAVLSDASRPLTAQEVQELSEELVPGIGIATVYRNLKAFHSEGWLELVEIAGQPARYELADIGHHHHFVCDACGKVYDIHGCAEGWRKLAPEGFSVARHELTLFGVCKDCD